MRNAHLLLQIGGAYMNFFLSGWFQLQDITNNAAEYAQSWLRRAKEAARQGKH